MHSQRPCTHTNTSHFLTCNIINLPMRPSNNHLRRAPSPPPTRTTNRKRRQFRRPPSKQRDRARPRDSHHLYRPAHLWLPRAIGQRTSFNLRRRLNSSEWSASVGWAYLQLRARKHALTLQLHTAHIMSAQSQLEAKNKAKQDVLEEKSK